MLLASLQDYLPLDDLVKIVVACAAVAVVAPLAVSLAIAGLDRRAEPAGAGRSRAVGTGEIAVGVAALAGLVAAGLYALVTG